MSLFVSLPLHDNIIPGCTCAAGGGLLCVRVCVCVERQKETGGNGLKTSLQCHSK